MDLIKQLGGYEKAKELTDHVRGDESLHKVLARDLLQYRREHNIFEVGDKVFAKILTGLSELLMSTMIDW